METGFKNAKLTLDEPRAIYYAGQVVSGSIECELSQPVSFTAVSVNFFGKAKVGWSEWETEEYNGVTRTQEVVHEAHEEYFNFTQVVCGGHGVTQLPQGAHRIPFKYQIPHNVPSSFSGERGEVSYTVAAFIDYPDPRVERDELAKEFEVVAPLDLNKDEDVKPPVSLEFEEFYSCCCSSSPMSIAVSLPATGFCPGQAIPITVTADNESNIEVKKIIFQLIQKECYRSQEPVSEYYPPEEVLEEIETGPILTHTKREFTYDLIVPDMIAPNLDSCEIIDVGYFFSAIIKLSGCNDDLQDETEISIGLVPLTTLLNYAQYTHPMAEDLPKGPIPEIPTNMPNSEVSYHNANFNNSNAVPHPLGYPNPAAPYPNPAAPYTNPAAPYPNPAAPYSNPAAPYANPAAPYTNHNVPSPYTPTQPAVNHPNPVAPYPNSAAPYPNSAAPYPNSAAPYPNSAAPYPNSAAPYPNSAAPYPNSASPYPNSASPNPAAPYPNSGPNPYPNDIPLTNMSKDMGFVAPNMNQPIVTPPYSVGQTSVPTHYAFNPSAPTAPPS